MYNSRELSFKKKKKNSCNSEPDKSKIPLMSALKLCPEINVLLPHLASSFPPMQAHIWWMMSLRQSSYRGKQQFCWCKTHGAQKEFWLKNLHRPPTTPCHFKAEALKRRFNIRRWRGNGWKHFWKTREGEKSWEGLNNGHIGADSKCPCRRGNISPQGAVDQEEMEQRLGHRTIFSQPALTVTGLIHTYWQNSESCV